MTNRLKAQVIQLITDAMDEDEVLFARWWGRHREELQEIAEATNHYDWEDLAPFDAEDLRNY